MLDNISAERRGEQVGEQGGRSRRSRGVCASAQQLPEVMSHLLGEEIACLYFFPNQQEVFAYVPWPKRLLLPLLGMIIHLLVNPHIRSVESLNNKYAVFHQCLCDTY